MLSYTLFPNDVINEEELYVKRVACRGVFFSGLAIVTSNLGDFVRKFEVKVSIVKTSAKPWTDETGILHLGLYDFLPDKPRLSYERE